MVGYTILNTNRLSENGVGFSLTKPLGGQESKKLRSTEAVSWIT